MVLTRILPALVLVLVLVYSLLAAAPARLIARVIPADDVVLTGLSGTVWDGRASRALVKIPSGFLHLGALRWTLKPLSLLTLSPAVELLSDWGGQRLRGTVSVEGEGHYSLEAVEGRVAADLLRQFAPLALGGTFDLQLAELETRENLPYSGSGRLVWERANWQSPRGPVALGTYALDFGQAPGEPLLGNVLTLSGPLEAQGRVELDGRRYLVDILVSSQERLEPQLQEALSLMATPEGDGYRLRLEAQF